MDSNSELTWENLKFLLPLIYMIPTFALYFVILYIIFASKHSAKFNGSFEILFGFSAFHYMLYAIWYYFYTRITAAPIFIPFVQSWGIRGFFITFMQSTKGYTSLAPHLFNVVLSFNRFTAFALKTDYQRFWERYLKVFLFFCMIIPFILSLYIPFNDSCVKLNFESEPNGTRYITDCHPENVPFMKNSRNTAIIMTFTSSFSLFFNCFVIARLLHRKYCNKNKYYQFYSNQDIKMFIYTMIIFVIEVCYCAQQYIFINTKDQTFMIQMFNIQYYLVDVGTLSPAWFILMTNKKLRDQIRVTVFRSPSSSVFNISSHSPAAAAHSTRAPVSKIVIAA